MDTVGVAAFALYAELVVGIGVVWSTPERDIAPPAAPSLSTVPLSVTRTVCAPDGGFSRYQREAFSCEVPVPTPTALVNETLLYVTPVASNPLDLSTVTPTISIEFDRPVPTVCLHEYEETDPKPEAEFEVASSAIEEPVSAWV